LASYLPPELDFQLQGTLRPYQGNAFYPHKERFEARSTFLLHFILLLFLLEVARFEPQTNPDLPND